MSILFRATENFIERVRLDLMRPHPFAYERVGFISARAAQGHELLVMLAEDYFPIPDEEYVLDPDVGAKIGQEAIRKALSIALLQPVSIFHVHMHETSRRLWFSGLDLKEQLQFVPDFFKVRPNMPHGALVVSPKAIAGRAWLSANKIEHIREFNVVGRRFKIMRSLADGSVEVPAHER